MSRDYTKYSVSYKGNVVGEKLNKRKFIFETVKHFAETAKPSLELLKTTFPDSIQGSKGMIRGTFEDYDYNRFSHSILIDDLSFVVSNQWSKENTGNFIEKALELGYEVEMVGSNELKVEESTSDVNSGSISVRVQTDDRDEIATCQLSFSDCSEDFTPYLEEYLASPSSSKLESLISKFTLDEAFIGLLMSKIILGHYESGDAEHIEAMMTDNYDWYEYLPNIVITRINDLELNLIYDVADDWEQPEDVIEKVCNYLGAEEDTIDTAAEDYVSMVRMSLETSEFMDMVDQLT